MGDDNTIVPLDSSEREIISRRTDEERERDRVLIARMYVRGKSIHEMMLAINAMYPERPVSSKAISLDLNAIRDAWLRSSLLDFNEAKAKELAGIDEAEREAWDAFERSKEKHIKYEYYVADDEVPFSAEKIAKVKRKSKRKIVETTVGDIRYLEMVERLKKMRCDILGLFEAKRIQVDWRVEALQLGMREDEIDAVKERTVNVMVEAITQAAKDKGLIKEEDIIDAEMETDDA
jgi:hypothetical protein